MGAVTVLAKSLVVEHKLGNVRFLLQLKGELQERRIKERAKRRRKKCAVCGRRLISGTCASVRLIADLLEL